MSASPLVQPYAGNLTRDLDLNRDDLVRLLDLAADVKRNPGRYGNALSGRYLALLFEKPSLRTRLTFELAIKQLGGDSVTSTGPIGAREPIKDVARNLERWTQAIAARVFHQSTIDELARWASIPVINALSDLYHPCQALADVLTIREHLGGWDGVRIAYLGAGNNVAHSLLLTAARLGCEVAVATPLGYEPDAGIVAEAARFGRVRLTNHPYEAVEGANVVYTDVWASMGQEEEADARRLSFQPYRVDQELFASARQDAIFMHCLPAHRDEEVSDDVIESSRSVVFDQAENRLHTQKAVLLSLLT